MKKENNYKDNSSTEQVITSIIKWLAVIFIILSIVLIFGAIGVILFDKDIVNWSAKLDLPKAALLGSYFGGFIGVFWAAAGSLLIFLNLYEQKQQFNKNQFDSSFFNLMNFYFESLKEITGPKEYNSPAKEKDGEFRGRRYLRYALSDFKHELDHHVMFLRDNKEELKNQIQAHSPYNPKYESDLKSFVNVIFEAFFADRKAQLGHYFRLIYNIINYIDNAEVTEKEKRKYVNLIQSQMSDDELGLIFYNGLSKRGDKMFELLEKYSFLENISKDGIIYPANRNLYPQTKFKYC